ncbi:hypothetical protein ASG61_20825 [Bacillus sp. Leaf75]|nr:hypothetical protein ASG61_20825 [Bacillus sp. Leaf75]
MNKIGNELYLEYPWLNIHTTVEEYIKPDYYNRIIKDYIFDKKSDLELFIEWLEPLLQKKDLRLLELGCGSGRATKVLIEKAFFEWNNLSLLDLSQQMLEFTKDKFSHYDNIKFINSDTIEFLYKSTQTYDVVYSLWSFSHSVHQVLTKKGLTEGKKYAQGAIRKFITENMLPGSEFFLIHFDSMSDEQKILLKQWAKVFPIFGDLDSQSLSKLLIDDELVKLEKEGLITFELGHHVGEEIEYTSEDDALEVFMNFHMESFFNESDRLLDVVNDLKNYFRQFTDKSGKVKIRPGCFIYKVRKV